jgi:hypothetical protein
VVPWPQALLLEVGIAHRQHLVDQQDVGLQKGGDGETQAHLHAQREEFDLAVDGVGEPGELDDLIESFVGDLAAHAEHGAVEEHVLASGEVGMDAAGHAEERTQAPLHLARPGRLVRDLADDLEQGGLAGAVDADEPQRSPRFHLEAYVLQHPAVVPPGAAGERSSHTDELVVEERRRAVGPELLPHVLDLDAPVRQCRQSSPPIA